jgi:hypothetical protein
MVSEQRFAGFFDGPVVHILRRRPCGMMTASLSLTRRRGQRASALARQLGGATTHNTRRAWPRIENRGWTAHGTRKGSRRRRNVARSLAVRRLRIARHHTIGRGESKWSLKSLGGSNDIRSGLRQSGARRSSHCQS